MAAMLVASALGLAVALSGCGPFGGDAPTASAEELPVGQIPWCDRPLLSFQDDSTTSQKQITSWDAVKDQLGFTPYLPPSLPKGACLALAGGSIHNPIYGGQLSITYVLPGTGPLSFSQAPKRQSLSSKTQCIQSTQDSKTTICAGVISNTSITIASRQPAANLEALFGKLQPNVAWVPAGSNRVPPTPTTPANAAPTATSKP